VAVQVPDGADTHASAGGDVPRACRADLESRKLSQGDAVGFPNRYLVMVEARDDYWTMIQTVVQTCTAMVYPAGFGYRRFAVKGDAMKPGPVVRAVWRVARSYAGGGAPAQPSGREEGSAVHCKGHVDPSATRNLPRPTSRGAKMLSVVSVAP